MQSTRDAASLQALVAQFATQRILAIGDLMLDEFIWGRVSRISPEAPVPVVEVTGESYYPGGAASYNPPHGRTFKPVTVIPCPVTGTRPGIIEIYLLTFCSIRRQPEVPVCLIDRIY